MVFYSCDREELLSGIKTDKQNGLTTEEANKRLAENGENKLKATKKKSTAQRFFEQFKDVMIIILIFAALVSFGIAIYEQNLKEFFEPCLILLIVIMNAIMGVVQESKAEKALEALQSLSALNARVIRNGKEEKIDAVTLVTGDIILLEAGDFVPADARLLTSSSLKSEESALTGESVPSEKNANAIVEENAPIGDRSNMIYSGCSITYGTARAVVTETGMNTEMGKIAKMLDNEKESQTPLQKKLADLGKYLGIIALIACAIIFVVGLLADMPILEIFMTSVSLAVSAIPEGLPAIVTIVLSIGVQRLVKQNAIIRRLPAVETLGSASVICSDKTGTLTQNKMTLLKAYSDKTGEVEDISSANSDIIKDVLLYGTLCSNGSVVVENGKETHLGDPTETSIVFAAYKNGIVKDEINNKYTRIAELPFDSDRKLMSTINSIDGKNIVIVKGAIDMLLTRCTKGNLEKAKDTAENMSKDALRVIAVAFREIETIPDNLISEEIENNLEFMGLVGMIDPPREEVKDAVKICRQAGIKPVMITGDHIVTASAIAKQIGILEEGDKAITGSQLQEMSDNQLDEDVRNISVYARVSPEDKIRIVKAWQKQGEVVSMTGDGVNDAPALKAADIGCAMGITGTDVAKGAADMTLTDDNFATIVKAVEEGRGIFDNIKKVVGFLLGTNVGEILTVLTAMLLWNKSPLLSTQLLWINLVTDSLPAIALGMEAVEKDVMFRKPKAKTESIFAHGLGLRIIFQGFMFAGLTLIAFYLGDPSLEDPKTARTMAFMVLALTQVVHAFNMRSEKSLFKIGPFSNNKLNGAALISFILVAFVSFIPPVSKVFGLKMLEPLQYLIVLGLSLVPVVVLEISKAFGMIKHQSK